MQRSGRADVQAMPVASGSPRVSRTRTPSTPRGRRRSEGRALRGRTPASLRLSPLPACAGRPGHCATVNDPLTRLPPMLPERVPEAPPAGCPVTDAAFPACGVIADASAAQCALYESLPDGVLVLDADGSVVHANSAAGELLGASHAAALVGRPVERLLRLSQRAIPGRRLRELMLATRPEVFEVECMRLDGIGCVIEASVSPPASPGDPRCRRCCATRPNGGSSERSRTARARCSSRSPTVRRCRPCCGRSACRSSGCSAAARAARSCCSTPSGGACSTPHRARCRPTTAQRCTASRSGPTAAPAARPRSSTAGSSSRTSIATRRALRRARTPRVTKACLLGDAGPRARRPRGRHLRGLPRRAPAARGERARRRRRVRAARRGGACGARSCAIGCGATDPARVGAEGVRRGGAGVPRRLRLSGWNAGAQRLLGLDDRALAALDAQRLLAGAVTEDGAPLTPRTRRSTGAWPPGCRSATGCSG